MPPGRRGTPRALVASGAIGLALGLLSACGSAPPPVDPTGVDGLTVPSPAPDPRDFVVREDVDGPNAWLALAPGREWRFEDPSSQARLRITVGDSYRRVERVATSVVRTVVTDPEGRTTLDVTDLLAQDKAGNVWRFGQQVAGGSGASWRVGTDGAGAALAMPAAPRVGDGYQAGFPPEAAAVVTVLDVGGDVARVDVPAGVYVGVLQIETQTADGASLRADYARGVGPVRLSGTALGGRTYELVDVSG